MMISCSVESSARRFKFFCCALILLPPIIFGLVAVLLGKDINWDLLNYHYYGPFSLINLRHNFDIAPAQLQSYINPVLDVPFYLLVSNGLKPVWVMFLLGCLHGIAGSLLFILAYSLIKAEVNRRYASLFAICALIVGISGASGFTLIGSTMTGWEPVIFILAGILLSLESEKFSGKSRNYFIVLSGVSLGISAGLKLTSLVYVFGVLATILLISKKPKPIFLVSSLGGVLIGFIAASGYWMHEMWVTFKNPIFPFMNHIFQSPWAEMIPYKDERFLPNSILKMIFYPFYWAIKNGGMVSELEFRDPRIAIVFCLVPFILYKWNKNTFQEKFLVIFFIISYILWQLQFSIYRYALPLELISGLIIINFIYKRIANKYLGAIVIISTSIAILSYTIYPNWGRTKFDDQYFKVLGLENIKSGSLVLLYGDMPASYIVPTRPDLKFLGINNNFLWLSQKNLFAKKFIYEMSDVSRDVYMVSESRVIALDSNNLLRAINLRVNEIECTMIESNVGPSMKLCKLSHGG